VEKAFAVPTRQGADSLPVTLRALTREHGFDRRAEVAVSLPLSAFFFADTETDGPELERIRAADTTWLKDYFPIPADDLIAQVCSVLRLEGGRHCALVAAASGPQLREALQSLHEGGIKPARLETPITAAHATILVNHPESAAALATILYLDESTLSLAVMHEGRLLLVRNIPLFSSENQEAEALARQTAEIVAQEIEITWQRLFGNGPDASLRIYLVAPPETAAALAPCIQEKTDGRVIPVNPYARMPRSNEVMPDWPLCVAEGLALRALQPAGADSLDFLKAYRMRTRPKFRMTKELTVCAGLALAAAVVWLAGLFLQLSSLEASYGRLKQQARDVFEEAVPEETNIVDPAAQLQQRLDTLRKETELLTGLGSGRPAPLEILYALSRSTPAKGTLKLEEVLIAADSVRILGTCDRFETLSEWQNLLATIPGLRVVDVPHSTKEAPGKVRFTISLSRGEGQTS
jgi:hypothetical protein